MFRECHTTLEIIRKWKEDEGKAHTVLEINKHLWGEWWEKENENEMELGGKVRDKTHVIGNRVTTSQHSKKFEMKKREKKTFWRWRWILFQVLPNAIVGLCSLH